MPTISPNSVASLTTCLTGAADYSSCPDPAYQTREAWLDGLMNPAVRIYLLTHQPCLMDSDDAAQVQSILNAISTITLADTGGKQVPFWDHVVKAFEKGSPRAQIDPQRLIDLARQDPTRSTEDILAQAGAEGLTEYIVFAAGY